MTEYLRPAGVVNLLLRYQTGIISLVLRIPSTKQQLPTVEVQSEFRSILQPFSVPFVPKGLPELTTFDHIYAPIQTNDPLYVQSVARHLHVNMIGSAMKACILERKSLCVRENSSKVANGDVAAGSPVLMLWDDISVLKLAAYALSHSWMKKLSNVNDYGTSNECKTCTTYSNHKSLLTRMASQWMQVATILYLLLY
jgi:hypothetical protein